MRAKALLTKAGYGAGFDLQLDCQREREPACRDVAKQLANVGIHVAVNIVPTEVIDSKAKDRTLKSTVWAYSNIDTFGDVDSLRYFYGKEGGDIEGYSYDNPKFDAMFERVDRENVTYAREGLIDEAYRMILQDDIAVVPLYHDVIMWAMRDNLDLLVSPVNIAYFREARLNPPKVN